MLRWLPVVVLVFGCSTQLPRERYCDDLAKARCSTNQRCGFTSKSVDCTKAIATNDCFADERPQLNSGALVYEPGLAAQCVDDTFNAPCTLPLFPLGPVTRPVQSWEPEVCTRVIHGHSAQGERCGTCQTGLTCSTQPLENGCGVCVFLPEPPTRSRQVGESCGSIFDCRDGLQCFAQRCMEFEVAGEACAAYAFHHELACVDGHFVVRPEIGEPCVDEVPCRYGLRCVQGVCAAIPSLGQACSTECFDGRCVDGVCKRLLTEGDSCDETASCMQGLECRHFYCSRARLESPGDWAACLP